MGHLRRTAAVLLLGLPLLGFADGVQAQAYTVPPEIIQTVERYYTINSNRANRKYGCNWYRVLVAFGATPMPTWQGPGGSCPNRNTPYTAAEASVSFQQWGGWLPILQELVKLERGTGPVVDRTLKPKPKVQIRVDTTDVSEGGPIELFVRVRPANKAGIDVNVDVTTAGPHFASSGKKRYVVRVPGRTTGGEYNDGLLRIKSTNDNLWNQPKSSIAVQVIAGTGYDVNTNRRSSGRWVEDDLVTVYVVDDDEDPTPPPPPPPKACSTARELNAGDPNRKPYTATQGFFGWTPPGPEDTSHEWGTKPNDACYKQVKSIQDDIVANNYSNAVLSKYGWKFVGNRFGLTKAQGNPYGDYCTAGGVQLNNPAPPSVTRSEDLVRTCRINNPSVTYIDRYVSIFFKTTFGTAQKFLSNVPEGYTPRSDPNSSRPNTSRGWIYFAATQPQAKKEYTVVVEGTATVGVDYDLYVHANYMTGDYPSGIFPSRVDVPVVKVNKNKIKITAASWTHETPMFKIVTKEDNRQEGPETVTIRLLPGVGSTERRVQYTNGEWVEETVPYDGERNTGSVNGRHPSKTITIADGTLDDLVKRPTLFIARIDAKEGDRGVWINRYMRVTGLTGMPEGYCFSGRLKFPGGRYNKDFSLYGVQPQQGALEFCRDTDVPYRENAYTSNPNPTKNAKLYVWKDLHDEATEKHFAGFDVEKVWIEKEKVLTDGKRIKVKDYLDPKTRGPRLAVSNVFLSNEGPLPKEWLARFGHSVAGQTTEAVSDRVDAPRGQANTVNPGMLPQEGETMDLRDAIMGSSFLLSGTSESGGTITTWGRIGESSFHENLGSLSVHGDNRHAMFGADHAFGKYLIGIGVGYHDGDGGADGGGLGQYDIEGKLTTVFPYGSVRFGQTRYWGTVGYGTGSIKLEHKDNDSEDVEKLGEADTTWRMAAVGVKSQLYQSDNLKLTAVADTFWTDFRSERAKGYASANASSNRQRLGIKADLIYGPVSFEPSAHLRSDGGDVENTTGLELSGKVRWEAGNGLVLSGSHRDGNGYRSWSAGAKWKTNLGTPQAGLSQSGEYTLGWSRGFRLGRLNLTSSPKSGTARISLDIPLGGGHSH